MYCTQCGCKIEDEYRFCPKCGCPVMRGEAADNQSELDGIADEIFWSNPDALIRNISKLQKRTKVKAETAKVMMDARFFLEENQDKINKIRAEKRAEKEKLSTRGREIQERMEQKKETRKRAKEERKAAHCPKCKSTSISYTGKKLSVGRGVVGYGLAGPTGAILGGLSSKEGYAVCLKCGKRWKI